MIDLNKFAASREARLNDLPSLHSFSQTVERFDKIIGQGFGCGCSRRVIGVCGTESHLSMEEFLRLKVIGDEVELFKGETGTPQTKLNRLDGQSTGITHTNMTNARVFFFFDGGNDFSILQKRSSRFFFLAGNS
jgi:hypothetical protein